MTTDLDISCSCGTVRGVLHQATPSRGELALCFCRDCQAAAHHLDRAELLTEQGGTGMYITTPAAMEFTVGQDAVGGFRFSPGGPQRWYATCCRTPLANTIANPAIPFLSVNLACLSDASRSTLGAPDRGIFVRDARGHPDLADSSAGSSKGMVVRVIWRALRALARGERGKSPFLTPAKQTIADPALVPREQRAQALQAAGF